MSNRYSSLSQPRCYGNRDHVIQRARYDKLYYGDNDPLYELAYRVPDEVIAYKTYTIGFNKLLVPVTLTDSEAFEIYKNIIMFGAYSIGYQKIGMTYLPI
jgi:hypothetical protein